MKRDVLIAAVGAAILVALVLATSAFSHSARAVADCVGFTVTTAADYPTGGTATTSASIDGVVVTTVTDTARARQADTHPHPWAAPLEGTHRVVLTQSVRGNDGFRSGPSVVFDAMVVCPVPPPPPPPDNPPAPPGQPPAEPPVTSAPAPPAPPAPPVTPRRKVKRPLICVKLRRAGASRASLIKRGCYVCPKRPVTISKQRLIRSRYGVWCLAKLPPPPERPFLGVTGELR